MSAGELPPPVRVALSRGRRYELSVFHLGLACCAVEFVAASMTDPAALRLPGVPRADGPREAHVMVVAGTVTDKLAPAVRQLYDAMPEPRHVISMGSCANCGGPYWDSYCVTKGVDQLVPVDVFVPGCPPRPEALLQGVLLLEQRLQEQEQEQAAREDDAGAAPQQQPAGPPRPAPARDGLLAPPRGPLRPGDLRRPLSEVLGP